MATSAAPSGFRAKPLGALTPAPAPARALTFDPTDCDQQRADKSDIREQEGKLAVRGKYQEPGPEQENERGQHDPPLPSERQSPAPAIALRGKPVGRSI